MGRIKTKRVKSIGEEFYRTYSERVSKSFDENKKLLSGADLGTKWLRNRVAGYLVRLKKQNKML